MLQGTKTTASSDFLKDYVAPYTATAIEKLLNAGAIPLVKENCDAFGHGSTNENSVFGAVNNAVNKKLVSGGSSGGSAVNVALDYTTFSIGGDTGGSIRQPAAYNQIYGMKPTYGKVSRYGIMAYASSTDCVGPLAAGVEDIEIVLETISGKDFRDQTTFQSDAKKYKRITEPKLGYYPYFLNNDNIDAKIKEDFLSSLEMIKSQGVKVIELEMEEASSLVSTYYALVMAETASNLARLDGSMFGNRIEADQPKESYSLTRSQNFSEESKRRIVGGNQVLSEGHADEIYGKAIALRDNFSKQLQNDFDKVDFILSPVSPLNPPEIGKSLSNPLDMYYSDIYTIGFSLAGLPCLTLPLGKKAAVQLSANKQKDKEILSFAKQLKTL